jgi:hypothetical protein
MTQQEFLPWIAHCLESVGIPFMVTGSVAGTFHSQPRTTQDVDLVIDPTPERLEHFLTLVAKDAYVSPDAARDSLRRRSMFNVIDLTEGWKADLIVRKERPFSIEEFQRRQIGTVYGRPIPVASAEDVILSKLEWDKTTPSERQRQDALNVAVAQWVRLDQTYLRKWAQTLGVSDSLEAILQQARSVQP